MQEMMKQAAGLSSRSVEAALGILIALISMWMVAFQWFSTYLPSLEAHAGREWMLGIPLMLYGMFQFGVATAKLNTLRIMSAMVSGCIFFVLAGASIFENGWYGAHVPMLGFCIGCYLWSWAKLTGLLPGGYD